MFALSYNNRADTACMSENRIHYLRQKSLTVVLLAFGLLKGEPKKTKDCGERYCTCN